MMNPREGLILALDGLDVQTIFVSTDFFSVNSSDIIMYFILPSAETSASHTICVEGPFPILWINTFIKYSSNKMKGENPKKCEIKVQICHGNI